MPRSPQRRTFAIGLAGAALVPSVGLLGRATPAPLPAANIEQNHCLGERYDSGFVDVGGWDAHVGQGAATGYLASCFEELDRSLAAGPVVGEQQSIEARTQFQNRDLPVLNDYRALLGGLLKRQFALSPGQLQAVFPVAKPRDLGLV